MRINKRAQIGFSIPKNCNEPVQEQKDNKESTEISRYNIPDEVVDEIEKHICAKQEYTKMFNMIQNYKRVMIMIGILVIVILNALGWYYYGEDQYERGVKDHAAGHAEIVQESVYKVVPKVETKVIK